MIGLRTESTPDSRTPVKVVYLVGSFHDDLEQFVALSREVDITLYGTGSRVDRWGNRQNLVRNGALPKDLIKVREFQPVVRGRRGHILWVYPGLHRALSEDRPDVVHVLSEPWGLFAVQAARWARQNPKSALVVHGCDRLWWHGSLLEQAARRRLARFTLARADGYAAESEASIQRARDGGLPLGAASAVIHTNPRSPQIFSPAPGIEERRAARRRLGLPADGISVGFIGELDQRKGSLVLLEALDGLGNRFDGSSIWSAIAGRGVLEDLVRQRALAKGAFFLGGLEFPDGVQDFFRSMDIICVPSRTTPDWNEQSPRVVIEAMMSGCLVVVSDCGANPEMVGDQGLVVPEGDPHRLKTAILTAIDLVQRGNQLGRDASIRARELYSGDAVAQKLVDTWSEALQRRRSLSSV